MNRSSGRHFLDMAVPAVMIAVLLLLLRASNQTPDGLSYALSVRTGLDMFHPHHLIYVPVARLIHLTAGVDPLTATLWQNLFWLVVLAFAAWRLAGRVLPGRVAPVLAAAGLLVLRGVLIYSVRVETYIPALACLALAAALADERGARRGLLVPVLALAVLYHQTNVLFIVPLAVLLRSGGWRDKLVTAGVFVGAAVLVLVPYILAAGSREPSVGFWGFVLHYARAPIEAWGSFGHFSPGGVSRMALSQVRMIIPVREAAAVPGSLVMLAGLVFLATWHVVHLRRGSDHRRLRLFGLVFLAFYLPFFLWWMPTDPDFFVATLLPLWLLAVIMITDLPPSWVRPPVVVTLVAVLAAGNIFFTILPMHRDPGPGRRLALALDRAAPPGAEMVVGYGVQQELLYFTGRTRVHEGDGLARAVLAGESVWFHFDQGAATVVIEGAFLRELLARNERETDPFLRWLAGYDLEAESSLAARVLPGTDAVQLGPDRRHAGSWQEVEQELRGFSQP
ncbi:MAG: hypothetical protein ABFS42_08805 [Candidatus Krumholzibacteriota bacterium]